MTAVSVQTAFPPGIAYGQIVENQPVAEETKVASNVKTTKVVATANTTESSPLQNTELIVRSYFKDIPVMIQIARCESGFRHNLGDGSVLRGVVDPADTGVMQINRRYHEREATAMNLNLNDIYQNMAYARHLYEMQGTGPWRASAPCWSQHVAMTNI